MPRILVLHRGLIMESTLLYLDLLRAGLSIHSNVRLFDNVLEYPRLMGKKASPEVQHPRDRDSPLAETLLDHER